MPCACFRAQRSLGESRPWGSEMDRAGCLTCSPVDQPWGGLGSAHWVSSVALVWAARQGGEKRLCLHRGPSHCSLASGAAASSCLSPCPLLAPTCFCPLPALSKPEVSASTLRGPACRLPHPHVCPWVAEPEGLSTEPPEVRALEHRWLGAGRGFSGVRPRSMSFSSGASLLGTTAWGGSRGSGSGSGVPGSSWKWRMGPGRGSGAPSAPLQGLWRPSS